MSNISDNKILDADFSGKDIESISEDTVVGRAEWLKARFDSAAKEVITPKVNGLIDALGTPEAAGQIGAQPLGEGSEATVAGQLGYLKNEIDGMALGQIPEGSLTDDKLSNAAGQMKDNVEQLAGTVEGLADTVSGKLDENQLATTEQNGVMSKEDKKKLDNAANPNLLINGDFQIWQRGESFTVDTTGSYTADRWFCRAAEGSASITITRTAAGMQFDGSVVLEYHYEAADVDKLSGKTVTLSWSVDGVTSSSVQTFPTTGVVSVTLPTSGTLNWIKLELGDEATPYVPKGYGEELVACMRYYQVMGTMFCAGYANAGTAYASYVPPVPLRTTPTLGGNVNNTTVRSIDAGPIYDQTLDLTASQSSGASLYLTTPAPNVTANRPCVIQFGGIVLDAEMG